MTTKQKEILDRIVEMRNQVGDLQGHLTLLRQACEQMKRERDAAIQRTEKAEAALKLYSNPENWRFSHDEEGNLLWITSLGPDYAIEILSGMAMESSEEREVDHIN